MKKFDERRFKKYFTFLVTLALLLAFVLGVHLFLGVSIKSAKLWIGSILPFLAVNLLADVTGIQRKLIVLVVSSIIMGIFFHAVLNWSLGPSLYTGTVILILVALLYMTFMN